MTDIEWTKADSFERLSRPGCVDGWDGKGENFDFKIRQYRTGYVVDVRFIKIGHGGRRLLQEKCIGQFKTAEEAQECAERYDAKQ